jgi:cytochrome c553
MKKHFIQTLCVAAALVGLATAGVAHAESTASPAAGEKKAAMCIGCHGIPGYQASFPELHKVPMIAGQSATYIAKALTGYAKGDRKHPTMRAVAGSLTEQDIADLAAFYEQQASGAPAAAPHAVNAAVQAQAKTLLAEGACVSCHGENFSKPMVGIPKLAGQHADYLYVALKAYQTNGNPAVGRTDGSMVSKVEKLSHAELKVIAQYLASLEGDLRVVQQGRFR